MTNSTRDPRSEAEKAIADLKRNAEMDMSVTESPLERQPSVTPDTFGVHDKPARLRSGHDQGASALGHARHLRRPRQAGAPALGPRSGRRGWRQVSRTAGHAAPGPRWLEWNPITWGRIRRRRSSWRTGVR
jgi:hypothetical protein